jgi:repressor LexA
MNLTAKQNEIVRFIWSYRRTHGMAPTLSEIAETLGVSKITVHEHIGLLEKKGAIKKEKYQSRSLTLSRTVVKELEAVDRERERLGLAPAQVGDRVSDEGGELDPAPEGAAPPARSAPAAVARATAHASAGPMVPLLGKIAAGLPIEALEDTQELDIAATLRLDRASFALKVRGDSMIDDGIRDGDFVLCERRTNPRDGETVVAILEGNEATLKRFYKDAASGGYRLVPANARLQPITVPKSKLEIRGVVVGQIRRY